jgi:transcription initiation factor TFIIIB Brf1 subunit/transcription initiation factor TFIIB
MSSDKVPTGAQPKTSGRKEAPDAVSCAEMKTSRESQNSSGTGSEASPINQMEKQISLPTVLQDRAKNSHGIQLAARDRTGKQRLSREQDSTGDVKNENSEELSRSSSNV